MAGVRGLGHVNLRAGADLVERLRRFYIDIVGLAEGPRPAFNSGSHGYWLYAGNTDLVHLTIDANGDVATLPAGHFNHLAFDCDDLAATRARLDATGTHYTIDNVAELGQTQLFLTDPAGMAIELTFTHP
ncbi:MAG TPA: VOC family protein [Rhodanobacteraceae bacterium]